MDADQWPLGVDVLKEQVKASQLIHDEQAGVERKARARARPEKEDALNCPRCNSTNTKFCYYNNYSLSQPRYFCKTCRRYWTEGGTTRNVPVGGGSRKNKPRSASICTLISSSSSSSPSSNSLLKRKLPLDPMTTFQNPRMILGVLEDLNLGSNYNSSSNHHPLLKNEHHVYYNSTSCGPAGAGAGAGAGALIPMFFGEGKSVDEFDQSPPANLSSSICHFMPPAAAGNSSIGFSFVGSTIAGTNNIINANNINVDHHHQYFKLQSLHEGGHGLIINDHHHHHHHIGNYGNDVAAAARTIQQGVFHETTSKRLISHHPHEEEPFTTSVLLLQAAADHRYQGQNNKGQLGESSGYSWGGGVSGRGGLW